MQICREGEKMQWHVFVINEEFDETVWTMINLLCGHSQGWETNGVRLQFVKEFCHLVDKKF